MNYAWAYDAHPTWLSTLTQNPKFLAITSTYDQLCYRQANDPYID